jgi:carboxymethylenebutenolidase
MSAQGNRSAEGNLTPKQQAMVDLWERHLRDEFELRSVDETTASMVTEPHNVNVPVLTGGDGGAGVQEYYGRWFIPENPPDTKITLISRTGGEDRLVDELVQSFTHSVRMDWMLPGIPPTGKRVEIPVVIVEFRNGKIASEHTH